MLALIGSFLVKLLGSGIVAPVLQYLNKRQDAAVLVNGQNVTGDVTVAQAQAAAYIEERKVIAQERAEQHLSPWTAWMIPTAFAVCLIHFGSIVFVSTFPKAADGWVVLALPTPYDQMENMIMLSVIGVTGISATVKKVFSR